MQSCAHHEWSQRVRPKERPRRLQPPIAAFQKPNFLETSSAVYFVSIAQFAFFRTVHPGPLCADVESYGHTKPTASVGRSNIKRMLCCSQRVRQTRGCGEALKTDKRKPPIRRSEALRDAHDWVAVGEFPGQSAAFICDVDNEL
jgi:hypothetical protein